MIEALGIIPLKVGASTAPSVRQVQVNEKTTTKIHKFADGSRTFSKGQPEYDFSFTCSALKEKQELLDLIEAEEASELTFTFELGARTYQLINCARNSLSISSDSDGTADLTISGVAPDLLRVR